MITKKVNDLKVDDEIMVSIADYEYGGGVKSHFAKVSKNGKVCCWEKGLTSKKTNITIEWDFWWSIDDDN